MTISRPLAPSLSFAPNLQASLPSFDDARTGVMAQKPRVYLELAFSHINALCKIHYHTELVRILESHPNIEGLKINSVSSMKDLTLASHVEVVFSQEMTNDKIKKSELSRVKKALSVLRGSLPANIPTIKSILEMEPELPDGFLLTVDTAAAYLSRLQTPPELGAWLEASRNSEVFTAELPQAKPSSPRSPRI